MELLTRDRSYYRQLEDSELLRLALYEANAELAVVLAERLDACEDYWQTKLEDAKEAAANLERTCNELDDKLYRADNNIVKLEWRIEELEKEIEVWRTKSK